MTTNSRSKCLDARGRNARARLLNLSDDTLADLLGQPGREVLLPPDGQNHNGSLRRAYHADANGLRRKRMRLSISVEEPVVRAGICVRCGRSVIDIFRAVVHRRAMYHAECWLQLMSAAAPRKGTLATDDAVSAAADTAG